MRIHCARCHRRISAKVSTCPHCGSYNQYTEVNENTEVSPAEKNRLFERLLRVKKRYLLWLALSVLVLAGNFIRGCIFYVSYLAGMFSLEEYLQYGNLPVKGIYVLGIMSTFAALCFIVRDIFASEEEQVMLKGKLKEAKQRSLALLKVVSEQLHSAGQQLKSEFSIPTEEEKNKSIQEKLTVLKELYEQELISEEEYAEKKKDLLKNL